MRIALVSGFWGQNIGNAFFNLGGKAALEAAGHQVHFVQDQPAYWTFRNEAKGNFAGAWGVIERADVDCVMLQGPVVTKNIANIWAPTIRRLRERGVDWALMSGGLRKYTDEEVAAFADLAAILPPRFVSTRDQPTADRLAHLVPDIRCGIDSAFFLPKAFEPIPMDSEPYVTFNFDHYPEPTLTANASGVVQIGSSRFTPSVPRLIDRLADRSKAHAYIAAALDRRAYPESLAGHTIVRPEHRTNPHLPAKIYLRPNAVASDEPWTYLTLYAGSQLTLADRVHACVATLAYGGRAMLHNPGTRRSALFDRVGAGSIESKPTRIDLGELDVEWKELIDYLEVQD